jgi:hypothetical protein
VLEMVMKDPNVARLIDYDAMIEARLEMELALGFLDGNELLKALLESGKSSIPAKIENGESVYQTQQAIEEQRRLEEQLYGGG